MNDRQDINEMFGEEISDLKGPLCLRSLIYLVQNNFVMEAVRSTRAIKTVSAALLGMQDFCGQQRNSLQTGET